MTSLEFEKHVDYCRIRIESTLMKKTREYRRGNNPFHNFDRAAKITGESSAKALKGMWMKHLVSIFDIIDDAESGKLPTEDQLAEKISDSINYQILLEGLIIRQIRGE